ncbi:hypothetical protein FB567DRAFT_599281 [Paraphoma chrysanthemicola]|uniref:Uncharacterized protein n=1 Tax=Paraphoma chrysanthemicola TaxID=798071 RepID=A0A8K0VRI5_9PLEO|nr:hypothetical protein FB567DRAFT_599281 [Paraphoma chrysanthemicola]
MDLRPNSRPLIINLIRETTGTMDPPSMPYASATPTPSRDQEALNGAQDLDREGVEPKDVTARSSIRLVIVKKEPHPLVPNRLTIFTLPGELRNTIYHLVLSKSYQRVPLNPAYNGLS